MQYICSNIPTKHIKIIILINANSTNNQHIQITIQLIHPQDLVVSIFR